MSESERLTEEPALGVGRGETTEPLPSNVERWGDGVFLVEVRPGPVFVFEELTRQTGEGVGTSKAAVRGRRLAEVVSPSEAARIEPYYRRCVETRQPQRYEDPGSAMQPDVVVQTTLVPVCGENGEVERIVGVAR